MKTLFTFIFCFLLFIVTASNDRAFKLLEKGKKDKAVELFEESLQNDAKNAPAHYGLASIFSDKKFIKHDAEKIYNHAHKAYLYYDNYTKEMQDHGISKADVTALINLSEKALLTSALKNNSLQSLQRYISGHKDAFDLEEALEAKENIAFALTKDSNTVAAYNSFIKNFANSNHLPEAKRLRDKIAFETAKNHNSVDSLQAFIALHPEAEQVSQAETLRNNKAYIELLEKEKQLQASAISEQKAIAEKIALEGEVESQRKESEKRTLFLGIGILSIVIISVVLLYLLKAKDNKRINKQKDEIEKQKFFVEKQKEEIQRKNDQMLESIRYAKAIQNAILPGLPEIKKHFKDAFIFYKPKDIVSGDFYWFAEIEGKKIVAALDCTGHGVPGAFMSMIGNTLMNTTIKHKHLTEPAEILNQLRDSLIHSLNQYGNESNDGMDASIVVLDKNRLHFSGAFNPLVYIRNNQTIQIKADRMPIGKHFKKEDVPFTSHTIEMEKNDMVYLFSDGYQDQFNNDNTTKFSSKKMRDLLKDISSKNCDQQHQILKSEIESWMGNNDQMDDMLVLGFRV